MTNEYVWGHNTWAATRKLVEQYGGEIIDEILVPQGTRDFSSMLLKVRRASPWVVEAAVGGDDQKAMQPAGLPARARREHGLDQQPAGLARRVRPAAGQPVRRVRHHLVVKEGT